MSRIVTTKENEDSDEWDQIFFVPVADTKTWTYTREGNYFCILDENRASGKKSYFQN